MLTYIIRRILLMIPTLLGVTMVVFFVMAFSPGGVGGPALNLESEMKAESRKGIEDYYNKRYGLDKPIVVQYVRWLNQVSPLGFRTDQDTGDLTSFGFKTPDLGRSWSRSRPVLDLFLEALPITIILNLMTLPIVYGLAISTGVIAAVNRGRSVDVGSNVFFLILYSIPTMWAGVMLLGYLANSQYLNWFPNHGFTSTEAYAMPYLPSYQNGVFVRGYLLDVLWHLTLPVVCLSYGGVAFLSRLTRSTMLENLNSDFARTARAKGLPERQIILGHVFRNSLIPLITILAGLLPSLFGGSVIIEKMFTLPGTGALTLSAVLARDREVIMASTLILGIIGMFCRLVADIGYTLADPRVSYE
jgi:peptide/nickel transport system permease protein